MDHVSWVKCARSGCEAQYTDHKWGAIRAHDEGWFIQRDGTSWCPEHVPEWRKGAR